jgi:hypothetical protein
MAKSSLAAKLPPAADAEPLPNTNAAAPSSFASLLARAKAILADRSDSRLAQLVVNLSLCVVLIPRLGIEGAAVATSTAIVCESIALFLVAKHGLGFHVFIVGGPQTAA